MFKSMYFIFFMDMCYLLGVNARSVNISDIWFLPLVRFPLFYRFFKDKVTWDEARSICNNYQSNLITLNGQEKIDVLKAYLKELDVLNHVWLGLKKEVSQNHFSWINGKYIGGDGYWLEPIPKSKVRLCSAMDPTADFRWTSFHCGGPETASFVCELKVPHWAENEKGCLVTEIPSVSIILEPEKKAVELISDCGLAGTRRILCKGQTNREELIRQLSCDEDPFLNKSTPVRTNESIAPNSNVMKKITKSGIMATTKGWSWTFTEKQTRHRRNVSPTKSFNISTYGSFGKLT